MAGEKGGAGIKRVRRREKGEGVGTRRGHSRPGWGGKESREFHCPDTDGYGRGKKGFLKQVGTKLEDIAQTEKNTEKKKSRGGVGLKTFDPQAVGKAEK